MSERIQKLVSEAGLMSRRAAEQAVSQGRIIINGYPALPGAKADLELDEVLVDGIKLEGRKQKHYLMLNKPKGYITSMRDEKGRRCVNELVKGVGERVYPVGRLDMYTEGLLLMTNDGDFANRVMHPSHELEKCYHVWVTGKNFEESINILKSPMEIDGYRIKPARVSILEKKGEGMRLSVTIHEGRNRQIRKMCLQAGLKVRNLQRVSIGNLTLGDLQPGAWRELEPQELEAMWVKTER